ncbi:MAG TPA: hypothetical protein VFU49_24805, partial [Ktedonobacteraceae bacterium]|nr:hypothetical protein [Ktedonobacteraceae bacterium]
RHFLVRVIATGQTQDRVPIGRGREMNDPASALLLRALVHSRCQYYAIPLRIYARDFDLFLQYEAKISPF